MGYLNRANFNSKNLFKINFSNLSLTPKILKYNKFIDNFDLLVYNNHWIIKIKKGRKQKNDRGLDKTEKNNAGRTSENFF